ncbi:MAG: hypothetical protein ABIG66_01495 [Candidatus Kerfeldbacteria bacterium]
MPETNRVQTRHDMIPPQYEYRQPPHGGLPCMWVHIEEWAADVKFSTLRFPHAPDGEESGSEATLWLLRGDEFHPLARRIAGRVELVEGALITSNLHPDLGAVIDEENAQLQGGDAFWMLNGHELPAGWDQSNTK